ncbi:MAG: hypothetical protein R3F61_21515 [Myxococcota bacterium]
MAKDPYGNDVVDPWDLAIAVGVMRSTWWSGGLSLAMSLFAGCCIPVRATNVLSPGMMLIPIFVLGFLSMAAGVNAAVRVFTMQPEHKRLVPSWHPWGALGLGAAGFVISALQMLGILAVLFLLPAAL